MKEERTNLINYLKKYHNDDIMNIDKHYTKELIIDFQKFQSDLPKIADRIKSEISIAKGFFIPALRKVITDKSINPNDISIKFINVDSIPLKSLLADKMGKLTSIKGTIKAVYEIRPELKTVVYECRECLKHYSIDLADNVELEPPKQCFECSSKRFKMRKDISTYRDTQLLLIEELQEELTTEEQPRIMLVKLTDDLINKVNAGNRVEVVGVLNAFETNNKHDINKDKFIFEANNIYKTENKEIIISDEEIKQINELSKRGDIIDLLIKSFTPSLIFDNEIKLAMLLYLVRGGKSKVRNMIHILFVSDPATGKTELKEYCYSMTEKGILASGTNASGVGLTGAVTTDPILKRPIVEAGAIPKAHKGFCFIDEMDKIPQSESKKILNYMENGKDTISKWGLNETLYGETSIMGLSNPVYGRFDNAKDIQDQIKLYPPLQSRFDLIFVLKDIPNQENDLKIANAVLDQFQTDISENKNNNLIPYGLLKKYITYARNNYNPVLPNENKEYLRNYYLESRKIFEETGEITTDTRTLQSITRLAGAVAKLHLRNYIVESDIDTAINLKNYSIEKIGFEPVISAGKKNRKLILKAFRNNCSTDMEGDFIEKSDLKKHCIEEYDMSERTFYRAFKTLLNANDISENRNKIVRLV